MKKRKVAYLQITRECNNKCVFCSNPQFEKEYTLDEAKKKVLDFKKENITEIILTGGEPTICSFLMEIISFIKNQEMEFRIISNGVKLEDINFGKKLCEAGLKTVHISIHSHDQKTADSLSQKPGHLKSSIQGVRNCLDCGLNVSINTTINSKNCSEMDKFISFMIKEFPRINHYVFNGLDPGKADGNLKSRAGENQWIVPKLIDIELPLKKTVDILKTNDKTFRIERIPLCYMAGFEEFSTETRKIAKDETYICSFIEKEKENEVRKVTPFMLRTHVDCCSHCKLNKICTGIQQEYLDIHGKDELYPVFINPQKIIDKII